MLNALRIYLFAVGGSGIIDIRFAIGVNTPVRDSKLLIRLNDSEKAQIEKSASAHGLASATWARNQLLKAALEGERLTKQHPQSLMQDRPTLLSLFCGCGGLDEGFRQAGFRTVLAFDIDEECVNTFNLNHSDSESYVRDVTSLTLRELDKLHGRRLEPVGVIGGPPCQSFSVSNVHQKDEDPRHKLPEVYAKLLKNLNRRHPISFFLFENVPGLLGKKHIERYKEFKKLFERAGFRVYEKTLDAKDYGVPQERERIFIVGINEELHPDTDWNPPTSTSKIETVRDTIDGMPEPVYNDRGLDPDTFPLHPNHWCLVPRSRKFGNADLKEGQAFGRSFRTLAWDKPSWAVAYGHREVHVHPKGHRRLSIYEAMLLQTFPYRYRLTGNMSAQIRLISDAVPVKLAEAIATSIKTSLNI